MQRSPRSKKAASVKGIKKPIHRNRAELELELSELNKQHAVISAEAQAHEKQKPLQANDQKAFMEWLKRHVAISDKMIENFKRMAETQNQLSAMDIEKITAETLEMEIAALQREAAELTKQAEVIYAEMKTYTKAVPLLSNNFESNKKLLDQNQKRLDAYFKISKKLSLINIEIMKKTGQRIANVMKTLPM